MPRNVEPIVQPRRDRPVDTLSIKHLIVLTRTCAGDQRCCRLRQFHSYDQPSVGCLGGQRCISAWPLRESVQSELLKRSSIDLRAKGINCYKEFEGKARCIGYLFEYL